MAKKTLTESLNRGNDIIGLAPQVVGRFYADLNRLGQRPSHAGKPAYHKPERWIGSSTLATNPPGIPTGGVNTCPDLGNIALRDVLADPGAGPRLMGEKRYAKHQGTFRVLIKLLDAAWPIPFHVHADDKFVHGNPQVYPNEKFGKAEAYHFLDAPKGDCPYTHVGLHKGVTMKDVIGAMRKGTDHVLELSPGALQTMGDGWFVEGGMLHRPGTALTLEIQQPSDVYTMFQTDFGGKPIPKEALHPGFGTIEEAAESVVNWKRNLRPNLIETTRLRPRKVSGFKQTGAKCEWIFPADVSDHFSGQRLTIDTSATYKAAEPFVLFVWRGSGTLEGVSVQGGGGPVGKADEFFVGIEAAKRGVEIRNTGNQPLVVFVMFAAKV